MLLLTGASGVLGTALLEEFAANPMPPSGPGAPSSAEVICLAHRRPVGRGLNTVNADLRQPRLGLSAGAWRELAARVSCIVHAAACTRFAAPERDMWALNVDGTQRILDLAQRAQAPVYHLSSAIVSIVPAAQRRGAEGEIDLDRYARSKRAAERLVLASGLVSTIVRPSLILGDSATGRTRRFQGVHMLARYVLEDSVPVLPVSRSARVDFLPQDVVASALAFAIRTRLRMDELWLTAGARALTTQRIVELTTEYAAEIGKPVKLPRIVAPEMIDRLIRPVFLPELPSREQRRFEELLKLLSPLSTERVIASDLQTLAEHGWETALDLEETFRSSLRYWGERKRIRARVDGVGATRLRAARNIG
jgi:thioester reductase-like protein